MDKLDARSVTLAISFFKSAFEYGLIIVRSVTGGLAFVERALKRVHDAP